MPSPAPAPPRSATPVLQPERTALRSVFEPGVHIGSWTVIGVLGEGATGLVYEVQHRQLRTRRALKVLTWAHPMLKARLLTEGRAQASLLHPNVVPVVDLLSIGGVPALVMELIEGPSLEDWLDEHRPTPAEAEAIFRGILSAVESAHAAGIIHRDLKPGNVLMAEIGGVWVPKVTDFGLAKDAHSDLGLTHTGMTMGTPGYMAPEQIRSPRDVDERADIFGLGCILYQLLCGEAPHEGPDALSVMNAVAGGSVTPLHRACPGVPRRLARAVRAAMQVDRERRPASCAELRALLDAVPQVSPAANRPSWIAWLGLAVGMCLIGVGGVSTSLVSAAVRVAHAEPTAIEAPIPSSIPSFPEEVRIVIPEPWVPDDIDPTLLIPEHEPPAPKPVRTIPRSGAPVAPEPAAFASCTEGYVRLARLARSPALGAWTPKKDLPLFHGVGDASPACTIRGGSQLTVIRQAERSSAGRFVKVRLP